MSWGVFCWSIHGYQKYLGDVQYSIRYKERDQFFSMSKDKKGESRISGDYSLLVQII